MKDHKTVFVSGNFNVLHPGHLRLLRFAKEYGSHLVVAVLSDRVGDTGAHIPEALRLEGVQSIGWVDEAFIVDDAVEKTIARLKPDVVVKGREYESKFNPEQSILDQYGGQLLFSSGEMVFSTLDLIRREFLNIESRVIQLPDAFMERHAISAHQLHKRINAFKDIKVCVCGDLIVDEYITCQPLGMSQEDPTIVVTPIDSTRFIGGAGIVAAHATGLGATTTFISLTGNDAVRNYAKEQLATLGVEATLLRDDSRPTTLKQRFRSKGKCLLRVSYLHQSSVSSKLQQRIRNKLKQALEDCDILVFSDFNYGCLPQELVEWAIQQARLSNVMVVADSQSSSQVGDISRFKAMDLITPTEMEARISTRNREDGLVVLTEQLRKQSDARNVFLKLGAEGLLVHADIESLTSCQTDRVPALNSAPRDEAGAGDSLLIASALTLASGGNIWEAACLGSLAAAIQISRVGNTPIQSVELQQALC